MKKKNFVGMLVMACLLLIGAGVTTVSAEALGEGWTILGGVSASIALLIIGFVIIGADATKFVPASYKKIVFAIGVAFLFIGGIFFFVHTPTSTTADITGATDCPEISLTATIVTGTDASDNNNDCVYDNDTFDLTIPLTVSDSSDGNLTDKVVSLNFTIDPTSPGGYDAAKMWPVYYKCDDYDLKYNGEKVFSESSGKYDVKWTDPTGTFRYEHSQDIRLDEEGWAVIEFTFANNTAGNWVTELSQIGESLSWTMEFWNGCGWRQTIDVTAMVVSYTA